MPIARFALLFFACAIAIAGLLLAFGLVPPNHFVGLRTSATLADPARWYVDNFVAGVAFVVAPAAFLAIAWFGRRRFAASPRSLSWIFALLMTGAAVASWLITGQ